MSTYRERRMARAERLREWAEKREQKADAAWEKGRQMADAIPLGQPILTDHYSAKSDRSYRNRMRSTMDRAHEHGEKARSMASRAANIEAQAEHAIYSDDEDAAERLAERIAGLEAERDRIKRYNASARKAAKSGGVGDLELLDEKQRRDLLGIARHAPYQLRAGNGMPAYVSSNLSGNIGRLRKRLEGLRGQA